MLFMPPGHTGCWLSAFFSIPVLTEFEEDFIEGSCCLRALLDFN
jgi:hypothetical protein